MSFPLTESSGISAVQLSPALRVSLFAAANFIAFILLSLGITLSSPENPRIVYVILVTVLCTSPILKLERINGPYFLLTAYFAFFFTFFGMGDLMSIFVGHATGTEDGVLTATEAVILLSGLGVMLGYNAVAKKTTRVLRNADVKDWPFAAVVGVGALLWIVGTASLTYWQLFVITDHSNASLVRNLNDLGGGLTTMFMLGQLVQPLGVLILAYAYAAYRRGYLLPMIIAIVFVQVVLGFVANYKSEAMSAGLLVIITKTYVDGRIPKAWLLSGLLFVALAFPVFAADRLIQRGEHGVTPMQAATNLISTLRNAIEAVDKVKSGFGGAQYRVQAFWERASLKSNVALIVDRAGVTSPYELGSTLVPIATAFIPKIIWSDKPSSAVGQEFNKTFHISEDESTYISPSHVGEVYWNFGWLGVFIIMPLTGALLGFIGSRCCAVPVLSLTRMLIMMVTIFAFVVRAEGSIATEYVVWLRSLAAIGLLHWVFARRRSTASNAVASRAGAAVPVTDHRAQSPLPFPQLLR